MRWALPLLLVRAWAPDPPVCVQPGSNPCYGGSGFGNALPPCAYGKWIMEHSTTSSDSSGSCDNMPHECESIPVPVWVGREEGAVFPVGLETDPHISLLYEFTDMQRTRWEAPLQSQRSLLRFEWDGVPENNGGTGTWFWPFENVWISGHVLMQWVDDQDPHTWEGTLNWAVTGTANALSDGIIGCTGSSTLEFERMYPSYGANAQERVQGHRTLPTRYFCGQDEFCGLYRVDQFHSTTLSCPPGVSDEDRRTWAPPANSDRNGINVSSYIVSVEKIDPINVRLDWFRDLKLVRWRPTSPSGDFSYSDHDSMYDDSNALCYTETIGFPNAASGTMSLSWTQDPSTNITTWVGSDAWSVPAMKLKKGHWRVDAGADGNARTCTGVSTVLFRKITNSCDCFDDVHRAKHVVECDCENTYVCNGASASGDGAFAANQEDCEAAGGEWKRFCRKSGCECVRSDPGLCHIHGDLCAHTCQLCYRDEVILPITFGPNARKKLADFKQQCEVMPNAHLASITSATEEARAEIACPDGHQCYIGMDRTDDGAWTWEDHSPWVYENWPQGPSAAYDTYQALEANAAVTTAILDKTLESGPAWIPFDPSQHAPAYGLCEVGLTYDETIGLRYKSTNLTDAISSREKVQGFATPEDLRDAVLRGHSSQGYCNRNLAPLNFYSCNQRLCGSADGSQPGGGQWVGQHYSIRFSDPAASVNNPVQWTFRLLLDYGHGYLVYYTRPGDAGDGVPITTLLPGHDDPRPHTPPSLGQVQVVVEVQDSRMHTIDVYNVVGPDEEPCDDFTAWDEANGDAWTYERFDQNWREEFSDPVDLTLANLMVTALRVSETMSGYDPNTLQRLREQHMLEKGCHPEWIGTIQYLDCGCPVPGSTPAQVKALIQNMRPGAHASDSEPRCVYDADLMGECCTHTPPPTDAPSLPPNAEPTDAQPTVAPTRAVPNPHTGPENHIDPNRIHPGQHNDTTAARRIELMNDIQDAKETEHEYQRALDTFNQQVANRQQDIADLQAQLEDMRTQLATLNSECRADPPSAEACAEKEQASAAIDHQEDMLLQYRTQVEQLQATDIPRQQSLIDAQEAIIVKDTQILNDIDSDKSGSADPDYDPDNPGGGDMVEDDPPDMIMVVAIVFGTMGLLAGLGYWYWRRKTSWTVGSDNYNNLDKSHWAGATSDAGL